MRFVLVSLLSVGLISVSGCATKQYPIASELSSGLITEMNCRELGLEEARILDIGKKIEDTASVDARSVAGFLGDFGIGNAVAKGDAEKSYRAALQVVQSEQYSKQCSGLLNRE